MKPVGLGAFFALRQKRRLFVQANAYDNRGSTGRRDKNNHDPLAKTQTAQQQVSNTKPYSRRPRKIQLLCSSMIAPVTGWK